jgi:hypothetical protein
MFILSPQNKKLIWQLPTPVASTTLAIYNAGTWKELFTALRFFSGTTLGFLHSLAVAANNFSITRADDNFLFYDTAWQWGNIKEIVRSWKSLGRNLPPNSQQPDPLPPMGTNEWNYAKKQIASNDIIGQANNWIDAIDLLNKQTKLLSIPVRKDHWENNNYVNEIESAIDLLLNKCLSFLKHWFVFYLDTGCKTQEEDHGCSGIGLVGPTPRRCQIKIKSCGLPHSRMHVRILDQPPFSLEPYCSYENISNIFPFSPGDPETTYKRTLHVLTRFECRNIGFALPELGIHTNRNDLYSEIKMALSHCIDQSKSQTRLNWGVIVIIIRKMRVLNTDLGHSMVDNILTAMDTCAAQYTNNNGIIRQPALYPFWRLSDEMLIPFSLPGENSLPNINIRNAVFEIGSSIAAAAGSALPRGYDELTLDIGFDLNTGGYSSGNEENFSIDLLFNHEKIRKQLEKKRDEDKSTGNILWLEHNAKAPKKWIDRIDDPFTRISTAAFGIIIRKSCDQDMEILLRYNHNHEGYNLIGGHMESVDNNMPSDAMQRELCEEIGLKEGTYKYDPLFTNSLRAIEFSDHKSARTCYFHNFYLIPWEHISDKLDTDSPPSECKWFTLEQIAKEIEGKGTNVRSFPLKHILKYLQSISGKSLQETLPDKSFKPIELDPFA